MSSRSVKKATKKALSSGDIRDAARRVMPDMIDFGVDVLFGAYENRKRKRKRKREVKVEKPEPEAAAETEMAGRQSVPRGTEQVKGVYGAEAKSYTGQTDVDYCVECAVKHSQTAKVLAREALQRASSGSPGDRGVQEKVRGVVEELCGLEDDTTTVGHERVTALNTLARELRKYIYTTGAEVGGAGMQELEEVKAMVDRLVEASYTVRAAEECPACQADDICGGDVECMQFMVTAAESSESEEDWKSYIEEARQRFSGPGR